ncbi:MAG: 16S rRNA (cytosine(1402)-N(4))-methyltransferase RsmH [Nitrosomonadales bacterium]|nr:16S rRNA (cytosine(1402)-N(4))-methyltransferase RsmH [Nitrosomonadales bacterium]MBT4182649.1 16S rRNA (cytosine(1402)-N(4))-methyltransferase RsmH [Nitrosomonadales bacterium]MBT4571599.1 16S rRNA (cytosine(1402)-N(4))-methyltransferase RsmH [Nitrosomonadales bacterium]MBT6602663.1 16S rRNA (cytosine(1402)-N(4))-methyltransferase RsmH [Nitrosomonadales bacterium]
MSTHVPVMLNEAINALAIIPNGFYIDCTFGRGGHSKEILKNLNEDGRLLALDKDLEAIKEAEKIKDKRFEIEHASFKNLKNILKKKLQKPDGILMDLGISSPQIDQAERGFSFQLDANLDMRMNQSQKLTASEIVNNYSDDDLVKLLYDYGEERFAKKIVKSIIQYREEKGKISRTIELAEIINKAVPKFDSSKNPATKTFQALRIKVNEELLEIKEVLPAAFEALKINGRMAIISFHSLEDRIIKNFIKTKLNTDKVPKKIPILQRQIKSPPIKVTQKMQTPSSIEISKNKRARSAKLRVIEKILEER